MNSINPALSSAILNMQGSAIAPASAKPEVQQTQNTQAVSSSSGNSTVSLGSTPQTQMTDYTSLNAQQRVRSADPSMQGSTNGNQTASAMTYSSTLQNTSAYFLMNQQQAAGNMGSGNGNGPNSSAATNMANNMI